MTITNIEEMRNYVLQKLGAPVIVVEVAPEQIDICITDSVQDFHRYNYGDGTYLEQTTLLVSAGVDEYSVSGMGIEAAFDINLSFGIDGINTLFTPTHMLLYNEWVTNGNYPGGGGLGTGAGFGYMGNASGARFGGSLGPLTQYTTAMQYLEQNRMYFGKHYIIKYIYGRETLKIVPTPQRCMVGSIGLYKQADAIQCYNHPLVKKLAVARAKQQWGLHLTKYNVTLPDGLGLQGQDLISQGREDEDKLMDRLQSESLPIDFFIG